MARYDPTHIFDAEYEVMLNYHLAVEEALLLDPDLQGALGFDLNTDESVRGRLLDDGSKDQSEDELG